MQQETDAVRHGVSRHKARLTLRRSQVVQEAIKTSGKLTDDMKAAIEKEWKQ